MAAGFEPRENTLFRLTNELEVTHKIQQKIKTVKLKKNTRTFLCSRLLEALKINNNDNKKFKIRIFVVPLIELTSRTLRFTLIRIRWIATLPTLIMNENKTHNQIMIRGFEVCVLWFSVAVEPRHVYRRIDFTVFITTHNHIIDNTACYLCLVIYLRAVEIDGEKDNESIDMTNYFVCTLD